MKKLKSLAGILMLLFSVVIFASCAQNKSITGYNFNKIATENGYGVQDVVSQVKQGGYDAFTTYLTAVKGNITCDFGILKTKEDAKTFYDEVVKGFTEGSAANEELKTNNVSVGNISTFTVEIEGMYLYFKKVENTIIYMVTKVEDKKEAMELMKAIGYK